MESVNTIPEFFILPVHNWHDNITREIVSQLYHRTKGEKLDYIFEGSIISEADFTHAMHDGNTLFFILYHMGITVGYVWVDGFVGRSCFIHFCFFRDFWGSRTVTFGHNVMQFLFDSYEFEMIGGLVPVTNGFALKYANQVMNRVGYFPKSIYNPETDEHKDAVLYSLCKGEVKDGKQTETA